MEIRDKVTNFVGEKIKTLAINTNYEKVNHFIIYHKKVYEHRSNKNKLHEAYVKLFLQRSD